MGLEFRKGKLYFYRKIRKGNKVITEYVGSGELARFEAKLHEEEKLAKKLNKQTRRQEQALHRQEDEELNKLEKTLQILYNCVAIINGYHKPKRQWRKKHKVK